MSLRNQLIGTWKSDKRCTLREFAPYLRQTDTAQKRFAGRLFGKLEIKWTRRYISPSFEGFEKAKYEVIDETDDTLVIRVDDTFPGEWSFLDGPSYLVIQFDETRYHKYYSAYSSRWNYVEWYRKVEMT